MSKHYVAITVDEGAITERYVGELLDLSASELGTLTRQWFDALVGTDDGVISFKTREHNLILIPVPRIAAVAILDGEVEQGDT